MRKEYRQTFKFYRRQKLFDNFIEINLWWISFFSTFAHRSIFSLSTKFLYFDNNSIFISMIRNSFKLTIINLNDNNHDENVNTIFKTRDEIIFIYRFYWIFFTNKMFNFIITIFNHYFYSLEVLTTQTQNDFNELSTTTSKD